MDAAQLTSLLLSALGAGGALTVITTGIVRHLSGSAGREKVRNADLRTQRDDAYALLERERLRGDASDARADREARNRGRIAETAATYRYKLRENGIDPDQISPWPDLEETIPGHPHTRTQRKDNP